jgi:hypothetical protein
LRANEKNDRLGLMVFIVETISVIFAFKTQTKIKMKTILSNILFVLVFISFQACGQKKMETNKMENLPKTEAEWKAKLSEEEYYILRQKGTERPYTGKFLMHNEKGV